MAQEIKNFSPQEVQSLVNRAKGFHVAELTIKKVLVLVIGIFAYLKFGVWWAIGFAVLESLLGPIVSLGFFLWYGQIWWITLSVLFAFFSASSARSTRILARNGYISEGEAKTLWAGADFSQEAWDSRANERRPAAEALLGSIRSEVAE